MSGAQVALTAAESAALTGTVKSAEEGAMEGVVVSARRTGAHFYVSVTSDEKGRYTFPATHLEPGEYTVTIRATGWDLTPIGKVTLTKGKAATQDLAGLKKLLARDYDINRTLEELRRSIQRQGQERRRQRAQRVREGQRVVVGET